MTSKTAYENGAYDITMDLGSGENRVVGLVLLMRVPGTGVVILELGQLTFDASGNAAPTSAPAILEGESVVCSILA